MVIDLLPKDEHHSQVNNRYYSLGACFPTSYVMGWKAEGIPVVESGELWYEPPVVYIPKGMQPEDYFMVLLRSEWGEEMRKELTPWFADDVHPNEIHLVVAEAANRIIGEEVCRYIELGTIKDIEEEIRERHPVVLSGGFTDYGHVVAITGLETDDDSGSLLEFLMNDPYGEYPDYGNSSGNDLRIRPELLDRLWNGGYHKFRKEGFAA